MDLIALEQDLVTKASCERWVLHAEGLSTKSEKELLQYLQDSNRSKFANRQDPALDVSLKLRLLMLCEARQ